MASVKAEQFSERFALSQVVGKNCIIGAGALVTGKMNIPDNSMALGSPARVVRKLTDAEIESNKKNAEEYVKLMKASKELK